MNGNPPSDCDGELGLVRMRAGGKNDALPRRDCGTLLIACTGHENASAQLKRLTGSLRRPRQLRALEDDRSREASMALPEGAPRRPPVQVQHAATGQMSNEEGGSTAKDARPIVRQAAGNTVLVNTCQRGNPIISHIRNVAWEYADILPDYQVGGTTGVLYLSLRYHRLHPEYIHGRIGKLGSTYHLRILLVMCDVDDHQDVLKELTKVAMVNNFTMMVAWSNAEAGRYIEIYKAFERKGPDIIKERVEKDYMSQLTAALTGIRGVNKTDVLTLTSNFGSLKNIAEAPADQLGMCPGLGEKKTRRLRDAFTQPFIIIPGRDGEMKRNSGPALN